ncbi:hypothetical protein [Rhizohabitans arisaemae]|uniref:hypothetical protein n=1 Tax=Rhizohabitans arisaemae TaxID=2720610 RepID=UPI0024B242F7|nr:hypothetical protein [Rhizohabitans arisaemae]
MSAHELQDAIRDKLVVESATQDIRHALTYAEHLIGSQTWQGARADQWAGEWKRRRHDLENLLAETLAELNARIQRLSAGP